MGHTHTQQFLPCWPNVLHVYDLNHLYNLQSHSTYITTNLFPYLYTSLKLKSKMIEFFSISIIYLHIIFARFLFLFYCVVWRHFIWF